MGFYVRHLKSNQAKIFASKIKRAFLNPTEKDYTTVVFTSSSPEACRDALSAAYAVLRDNPQIFYYAINLFCKSTGNSVVLKAKLLYTPEMIRSLKCKINNELNRITSCICKTRSKWEIERALFEYVHNTVRYLDDGTDEEGNLVGPLLLKRGVCEGISKLFAVLCHKMGIPCILVFGSNHMWNMVSINGESAHVDATWGIRQQPCNYSYFNVPDTEIMKNHKIEIDCIPKCRNSKIDYYHVKGVYFRTEQELKKYLKKVLFSGKETIHVKLEKGDAEDVLKSIYYYLPGRLTYVHNKETNTLTIQQLGGNIWTS